jgi:hypothetical protein
LLFIAMSKSIDAELKKQDTFSRIIQKRRHEIQFFADRGKPALPTIGISDHARPLRTCVAAMPAGATMNLGGSKVYCFASLNSSDPILGGGASGEISLHSAQA